LIVMVPHLSYNGIDHPNQVGLISMSEISNYYKNNNNIHGPSDIESVQCRFLKEILMNHNTLL